MKIKYLAKKNTMHLIQRTNLSWVNRKITGERCLIKIIILHSIYVYVYVYISQIAS